MDQRTTELAQALAVLGPARAALLHSNPAAKAIVAKHGKLVCDAIDTIEDIAGDDAPSWLGETATKARYGLLEANDLDRVNLLVAELMTPAGAVATKALPPELL